MPSRQIAQPLQPRIAGMSSCAHFAGIRMAACQPVSLVAAPADFKQHPASLSHAGISVRMPESEPREVQFPTVAFSFMNEEAKHPADRLVSHSDLRCSVVAALAVGWVLYQIRRSMAAASASRNGAQPIAYFSRLQGSDVSRRAWGFDIGQSVFRVWVACPQKVTTTHHSCVTHRYDHAAAGGRADARRHRPA